MKFLTNEGEKNIEDIEDGDKVLAKMRITLMGISLQGSNGLYRNQRDDIIKLHVGEQIIEKTDNHPFWVEEGGYLQMNYNRGINSKKLTETHLRLIRLSLLN
ncbi:hypothetical protein FE784_40395 [Paenibacillus hemerocallicola]|uniref:Hint domain-containing protein n=1 Tax=Paenibacillus hemerocallicola TaxID=1172614 RepID=A0A5C4SV61_9BACL|nr:hypothetical protein FE784_40395 [Paenibacillus hemerocallicola]